MAGVLLRTRGSVYWRRISHLVHLRIDILHICTVWLRCFSRQMMKDGIGSTRWIINLLFYPFGAWRASASMCADRWDHCRLYKRRHRVRRSRGFTGVQPSLLIKRPSKGIALLSEHSQIWIIQIRRYCNIYAASKATHLVYEIITRQKSE